MSETLEMAEARLRTLTQRPGNEELLELYALYKQAQLGDCLQGRPGMFDLKAQAKWSAWKSKKGLPQADAEQQYVALVDRLMEKYPSA